MASEATGPTTATDAAIAWTAAAEAAEVTSVAAEATPAAAGAAHRHATEIAGAEAGQERDAHASSAKAAASSAMKKAISSATALTTAGVADRCTGAQAGTTIETDTTRGEIIHVVARHPEATTTGAPAATTTWAAA